MSQPGSPSNSIKKEEEDSEGQIATQLVGSDQHSTPEEEIQVLLAIEVVTARTRSNTARSYYQSQPDSTPPEFWDLIPIQEPILQPVEPQPRIARRMAMRAAPVLQRAAGIAMRDELEAYGDAVEEYIGHSSFFLTMLQEDGRIITDNVPARPTRDDEMANWLNYGHDLMILVNRWQTMVNEVEGDIRRRIAAPGQAPAGPSRRKFPLPGKYNGKIGDPAATFLIQCENYFVTEGTNWTGNYKIRWALQFLEDKAGPLAIQQLNRMETDLDVDRNLLRELD